MINSLELSFSFIQQFALYQAKIFEAPNRRPFGFT